MIDTQKFRDTLQTFTNFLVAFIIALLIALMINNVNVTTAYSESVDAPITSSETADIQDEPVADTQNNDKLSKPSDLELTDPEPIDPEPTDTELTDPELSNFTASDSVVAPPIDKKETLRCGYTAWAPAFIIDPQTKEMSGYAHDVIQKIAKDLEWTIEWVEHPAGTSPEEQIKAGLYDVLCSGSCSPTGKPQYDGLIYTSDDIWMSQTYMETTLYEYPEAENKNNQSYALSTMGTQLIDKIAQLNSPSSIDNGYNIKMESSGNRKRFDKCKNAFVLPASDMKFKFMIDNLLRNMGEDGTLERIAKHYMDTNTDWRIEKYMTYIGTKSLDGMLRGPASGGSGCSFIEDLKSAEQLTQPKAPDETDM